MCSHKYLVLIECMTRSQSNSLKNYFFAVDKLSVVTTIKRLLAYLSTLEVRIAWTKRTPVARWSRICLRKSRDLSFSCIVGQGVKTLSFHGSSTGSNPVRCIVDISTFTAALSTAANGFFTVQSFLSDFPSCYKWKLNSWKLTQVWLKRTHSKCVRCVKACKGSNPLSSLILSRGGAVGSSSGS